MSPTGDLHVTLIFSLGRSSLELAQGPSRVALAWHDAGSSTPFGVTIFAAMGILWHELIMDVLCHSQSELSAVICCA